MGETGEQNLTIWGLRQNDGGEIMSKEKVRKRIEKEGIRERRDHTKLVKREPLQQQHALRISG